MNQSIQKSNPSIQNAIREAKALLREAAYSEALTTLQTYLDADLPNAEVFHLAAKCKVSQGKLREARYLYLKAIYFSPGDMKAYQELENLIREVNSNSVIVMYDGKIKPKKKQTISLVMIVKNESENLPECLKSYQDLVDEIIVVDTGSTDDTVAIAKSFGARVEYFPWIDDFSAARNYSLQFATCDWILRTDADEYIEDSEKPKLLQAINSGNADIYICPTCSLMPDGKENIVENVRLIRNHLGVQYTYPMHETVGPSATKLRLTQAITNIKFIHTGYHIEADQLDKKLARNIAICEKALAKNPDDLYLQFIKLNSQGHTDPENALNALEKIVFDVPDDTPIIKYHAAAYLYLANREFQRKNREQVARIVRGLVIDFPFDSHLLQFAGELALYELQDLDEALFILTIAQERRATHMIEDMLPPTIYNLQNIRWRLVEVSVLLGDLSRAKHYYSQIEFPNHRKLDAKRKNELHHLLEQNDPEKFLKESQDVLLDDVKLIRARAKMLLASQQWSKAIEEILNAASKTGLEFTDLLDLATCQTQSGHDNYAEYMLDMARRIEADHPIEASIRSFIAARQGNHEKALDYAARAFLLESSNPNFQANLEHLARHLGKNPVDVLKEKGSEWQANLDLAYSMRAYIAYSRFHPEDAEVKSILDDMLKPS